MGGIEKGGLRLLHRWCRCVVVEDVAKNSYSIITSAVLAFQRSITSADSKTRE
jgi:hypothetical protein